MPEMAGKIQAGRSGLSSFVVFQRLRKGLSEQSSLCMKSPRVVVYFRVSTAGQDFASQRRAVLEYCRRRSWRPRRTYQEKRGGYNAPRTVLDSMLRDARAGAFDMIVIYKLDRLGRSSIHLAQILHELTKLKIGLVSCTEGIDTTKENPMASFVINVLTAIAQLERERIRERSSDGLRAARARGVKIGRPPVDRARLENVKRLAVEHLEAGRFPDFIRSIRDIARAAGVSVGTAAPLVKAARLAAAAAARVQKVTTHKNGRGLEGPISVQ